jgi:hypothetical protein
MKVLSRAATLDIASGRPTIRELSVRRIDGVCQYESGLSAKRRFRGVIDTGE